MVFRNFYFAFNFWNSFFATNIEFFVFVPLTRVKKNESRRESRIGSYTWLSAKLSPRLVFLRGNPLISWCIFGEFLPPSSTYAILSDTLSAPSPHIWRDILRGGHGGFWIFYSSQAYSTELSYYYWFVITQNFWNFQGNLWIIPWDIQVLSKKSLKVKKFPAR